MQCLSIIKAFLNSQLSGRMEATSLLEQQLKSVQKQYDSEAENNRDLSDKCQRLSNEIGASKALQQATEDRVRKYSSV